MARAAAWEPGRRGPERTAEAEQPGLAVWGEGMSDPSTQPAEGSQERGLPRELPVLIPSLRLWSPTTRQEAPLQQSEDLRAPNPTGKQAE